MWPTTQKETIERWFCPKHFAICFSEKRWQRGAHQQDWGIPRTRGFGQQDQQQFQSPRCLFMVGLFGGTTSVPAIGTEALLGWGWVMCTTHTNGIFCKRHFYLLFWTKHVTKEQDLTSSLTLLASTVPACCLWLLPEIHICWASCCLLWLFFDLFLLGWFYLPIFLSSVERGSNFLFPQGLERWSERKNFLIFKVDVGIHL